MNQLEIVKQTTIEVLNKMNFQAQVELDDSDENNLLVNIQTDYAGFLIGQAGNNLTALQHLIRVLVHKKNKEPIQFILDINNYHKNRLDLLRRMAKDIAQEALAKRVSLVLHPMSAYERRVVHMALADQTDIETTSTGEEPERRIVIKPKISQ